MKIKTLLLNCFVCTLLLVVGAIVALSLMDTPNIQYIQSVFSDSTLPTTGDINNKISLINLESYTKIDKPVQEARQKRNSPDTSSKIPIFNHTPMTREEYFCIYYPVLTNATRNFQISAVNFKRITRGSVSVNVTFVGPESVAIRSFALIENRDIVTTQYCNNLWLKLLPLNVETSKKRDKTFQPKLHPGRESQAPQICIQSINWVENPIDLGADEVACKNAPYRDQIHNLNTFPKISFLIWQCGNYMYTNLVTNWEGFCFPYWKTNKPEDTNTTENIITTTTNKPPLNNDDLKGPDLAGDDYVLVEKEVKPQKITPRLTASSNHPFYTNSWYTEMLTKVRTVTQGSCYACSMLPSSSTILFPYIAVPVNGGSDQTLGQPTICILIFQSILRTNPVIIGLEEVLLQFNYLSLMQLNVGVQDGHTITTYLAFSNITTFYKNGTNKIQAYSNSFTLSGINVDTNFCFDFYEKHILNMPFNPTPKPLQISASINNTASFDLCISSGLNFTDPLNINMGSLKTHQCKTQITLGHGLQVLAKEGFVQTPGFYWCCDKNILIILPHKWVGLCGMCNINELTYIVQPFGNLRNNTNPKKQKRGAEEYFPLIHLIGKKDPKSLSAKYDELPDEFKPFTRTQMFFKSWFASTSLQYDNHYLIAITRHNLVTLSNETIRGFQAINTELDKIKTMVKHNRLALDYLTAEAGGVCSVIGVSESCCSYFPSSEEGTNNLSLAIKNLQDLNQEIIRTNMEARETGGFSFSIPWLNKIAEFFSNNSLFGWIIGLFMPFFMIILVTGVVICCCLPLIRKFVLKSISSSFPLLTPAQNNCTVNVNMTTDSVSLSSNTSSELSHIYPHRRMELVHP